MSSERAISAAATDCFAGLRAIVRDVASRDRGQAAGSAGQAHADRSRGVAISQRAGSQAPGGQKGASFVGAGVEPSRLSPKQSRSLEFFYQSKKHRAGLKCSRCSGSVTEMSRTGICRACWRAEVGKAKADREAEKSRERAARAHERKARAEASTDRRREREKAWREANRDRNTELQKDWRSRNPEKVRAAKRGRKVAKRSALVSELSHLQAGRCAYCRTMLSEIHVDHIQPRARRGSNERRNLQLTCAPCNIAKGAKDPLQFARETGRLL